MSSRIAFWAAAIGLVVSTGCHEPRPGGHTSPATTQAISPATPSTVAAPSAVIASAAKRPPKPRPVVAPNLPSLPALAKHEKPPSALKRSKDEYACGSVDTGDEHVELDCVNEHDGAKLTHTLTHLVRHDLLSEKLPPAPPTVDHRVDRTEALPRKQSGGTCSAFGAATAIDHSVARWTGAPAHVSVMQLWARYHRTSFAVLDANAGKTLAVEETWPYDGKIAWPWRDCPKDEGKKPAPCGKPVDSALLAAADAKPAVILEQVELLPKDFSLLRAKIAAGEDALVLVKLGHHWKPAGPAGSRYIPDYDEEEGGHFLAVSGYTTTPDGDRYYLLHNSWGTKWGDGGYAWIHEHTLEKHMFHEFAIVDARPVDGPRAHRGATTCANGLAPDSVTAACAPACADGSPRHDGACPDPSDCAKGFVNLVGSCVAAAPRDASRDPASNIAWRCGDGGCTYTLPKNVGACASDPCLLSCPAPAFRAARDHLGLTCAE